MRYCVHCGGVLLFVLRRPKRDLIEFLDEVTTKKPNVYVYVDLRKRAMPPWAKLEETEGVHCSVRLLCPFHYAVVMLRSGQ